MTDIVTLSEVKSHLRIAFTSDDSLLAIYMGAAQEYITNFLNQEIPGLSDSPVFVPYSIRSAALLIIGDLYENREGAVMVLSGGAGIIPNPAVNNLLYPYRVEIGI
jgi:hypothetical protein